MLLFNYEIIWDPKLAIQKFRKEIAISKVLKRRSIELHARSICPPVETRLISVPCKALRDSQMRFEGSRGITWFFLMVKPSNKCFIVSVPFR